MTDKEQVEHWLDAMNGEWREILVAEGLTDPAAKVAYIKEQTGLPEADIRKYAVEAGYVDYEVEL